MKILFLGINLPNLGTDEGGFYVDLIKELGKQGHQITCIAPSYKRGETGLFREGFINTLRVAVGDFIGNIPFWKKGINIFLMTWKYIYAYRKWLKKELFDIILLPTPPVSLVDVVTYVQKCCGAKLYLILRDIHPDCLDRKEIPQWLLERTDVYEECKKPYGVNPVVYYYLYKKAQKLYSVSKRIGCMSPGNIEYIHQIAPFTTKEQLVLLPNWYNGNEESIINNILVEGQIRDKYNLQNKFIAIFGGTIGEAQAVWNIAQLAKMNLNKKDVVFLVVGRGVKKEKLQDIARKDNLSNMLFLQYMPKNEYEILLKIADLGLISIDEKYKVPTCPSKIIGYMALAKPVLAMFNRGNDYGEFYIDKSRCGLWSVDLDYITMQKNFEWFYSHPEERRKMGMSGYHYYKNHLTVEHVCNLLEEQLLEIQ